ncbi:unnamed protein product [Schistosoma curassoni]|uniref:Reverse transcriptase domain-containing protein n=1 Tax=Schistosoma curassoni TaxID=6186 RepID=A0A183K846_9TREM|nr:unnamed protein product [Schistosoma curassoni]
MKTSTSEGKHGIQWTAHNQLDDLDFADDLVLLSYAHEQMKMKTTSLAAASASVGLNIRKRKSKILECNTENTNQVTIDGEAVEAVESFTYLGSHIDEQGGSHSDLKTRIYKKDHIPTIEERLELKATFNQHQSENLQYEHQDSSNVRR